tara:strand:+ start:295 stop:513 length:219 start_codon:yes stop_codon:yes gene_type:complete
LSPQVGIIAQLISTLPLDEQEELLLFLSNSKAGAVSKKLSDSKLHKPSKSQQIIDLALSINRQTRQHLDTNS